MNIFKKHRIDFHRLILPMAVVLFSLPSFYHKDFFMTHDGIHHLIRAVHYFEGLKEGQIPVVWAGYMNKTYGSPIFIYTPPLLYWLTSILKLVGLSTFLSFKILILMFNFVFIFGSYFWLKQFFNKNSALIASLVMLFNPYRISQIYVRGAFNEFVALSFIPLVVFCLYQSFLVKKNLKTLLLSSLCLSLCLLSHSLVIIILIPVLLATLLMVKNKLKNRVLFIQKIFFILFTVFLLTAFIYWPILFRHNDIKLYLATSQLFKDHFLKFWQLVDPGWGFGFSMPGTKEDGMSFQLGVFSWLAFVFSAGLLMFKKIRFRTFKVVDKYAGGFLLLTLIAVFFMVESGVSYYLYDQVVWLKNIQFPWRFLNLSLMTTGFLTAYLVNYLNLTKLKTVGVGMLVILLNLYYLKTNVPIFFSDKEILQYESDSTFSHEYTPVWRDKTSGNDYILKNKVYSVDKKIEPQNLKINSGGVLFTINELNPITLRVNTLYFPGLTVTSNGKRVEYKVLQAKDNLINEDRDISGIIEFKLDSGINRVKVYYGRSFWGKSGYYLSLISWLSLIVIFVFPKASAPKK